MSSDWKPTKNTLQLKLLGKLLEEAGELVSAASRCLIQGIDEKDPKTGQPNREWLEDELADVHAKIYDAMEYLHLDNMRIIARSQRKRAFHESWFKEELS